MKSWLCCLIGVGMALALVSTSANAGAVQASTYRQVSYGGVSFSYDTSLARQVTGHIAPEMRVGPNYASWTAHPEEIQFDFSDFHGPTTRTLQSGIFAFQVLSDYTFLTPAEKHDLWLPQVQWLQDTLSKRPDLRSAMVGQGGPASPPETYYIPPINAAEIFMGKPGYFNFQNGSGIHSLIFFTQDASPPKPDFTFYTFQGITSDGRYYISASFPAFPASIQPIAPPQGDDIRSYYLSLADKFTAIGNDAYTPNLDKLDAMMASLSVHPTGLSQSSGLPPTGERAPTIELVGLLMLAACLILGGLVLARKMRPNE